MWVEGQGKRGSSEVASAILKVLNELRKKKTRPVNELIMWSDGCTEQNKNFFIVAQWSYAIHIINGLNVLKTTSFSRFEDETSDRICIDKDKPFVVQCKYTYTDLESYTSFNILKTGRPRILPRLVCKYEELVEVAPAKVKDLEKQMQYMPPSKMQPFWNDIFVEQSKLAANAKKINTHGCTDINEEQETTISIGNWDV
ncbi:hypothetical protein PR048_007284 [Dryococelus australis]|uniref:Uncharacterized protein n=1 Tax=Dryococelus australis TaxID=614101 RepID=A0ABQ9ID63_9NEOP|nr:hypothetical protein PR048_007284 [Dryococelus australis]